MLSVCRLISGLLSVCLSSSLCSSFFLNTFDVFNYYFSFCLFSLSLSSCLFVFSSCFLLRYVFLLSSVCSCLCATVVFRRCVQLICAASLLPQTPSLCKYLSPLSLSVNVCVRDCVRGVHVVFTRVQPVFNWTTLKVCVYVSVYFLRKLFCWVWKSAANLWALASIDLMLL